MTWIYYDDSVPGSCLASGFGLTIVPESLNITNICQDPLNVNIVYVDLSIAGAFQYDLDINVSWTDPTTGVLQGPFSLNEVFISSYKNTGLPSLNGISPSCGSIDVTIAFNCGTLASNVSETNLIPDFASIPTLDFFIQGFGEPLQELINELIADGVPEEVANSVAGESSNPMATGTLSKGLSPEPYKIVWDPITLEMQIQYLSVDGLPCSCAINCVDPTSDDFDVVVCEDQVQTISTSSTSIIGDPTNVSITFKDAVGNTTLFGVHSVVGVIPKTPGSLLKSGPSHVQVVPFYSSINEKAIQKENVSMQVWRYVGNPGNGHVWKDWSSKLWNTFYDKDIEPGTTYGYAVKFKGEFNEESYMSSWSVITA
jgi:hypothetical protein